MNVSIKPRGTLEYWIAVRCAQIVHAAKIDRHLQRLGYAASILRDDHGADVREVREFVTSIGNADARREVVAGIKYAFKTLRQERGTQPRWQRHVMSVARCHGAACPQSVDDLAWDSFILRERAA